MKSYKNGAALALLKMDKDDTLIILTPSNSTKNPDEKICRIFKSNLATKFDDKQYLTECFFSDLKQEPAHFSIILDLLNKTNLQEYYANKKQDK